MKKRILLTGGSGFVGSNISPILMEKYEVIRPNRSELEVRNREKVVSYVKNGNFDVIIHTAYPTPVKNAACDSFDTLFADGLNMFMNFYSVSDYCEKIIYTGTGAEYNKKYDIVSVTEDEIGKSVPEDDYGLSKFIINNIARNSRNIYNLRLFGCYGPGDHYSKFITHAIRCCLRDEDITIRQDCYFDYLHVFDLGRFMDYFVENTPKYHDYNATSGCRYKLSELAQKVKEQMNSSSNIVIKADGMNKEYTANNDRIVNETGLKDKLINIDKGIAMQILWEREHYNEKESC